MLRVGMATCWISHPIISKRTFHFLTKFCNKVSSFTFTLFMKSIDTEKSCVVQNLFKSNENEHDDNPIYSTISTQSEHSAV